MIEMFCILNEVLAAYMYTSVKLIKLMRFMYSIIIIRLQKHNHAIF